MRGSDKTCTEKPQDITTLQPPQDFGKTRGMPRRWLPILGLLSVVLLSLDKPQPVYAAKCLFISSYHRGYAWSDGVERGMRSVLTNRCEVKQFDMDSKRHKDVTSIKQKALEAKALIEAWQPDVVITADDNAAKYLIQPFYKNHPTPFVFCGINWTVQEYGFPYRNVTGMIEVAPVEPLLDKAATILPEPRHGLYLGANTLTEHKNAERFLQAAQRRGLQLEHRLVESTEAWLEALRTAQELDFVILGSNSGIQDWDEAKAREGARQVSQRLSLTNSAWMMPYAMLGLTKVPEEHGEWAATAALHILSGVPIAAIPIVPSRKWDIWVNLPLLENAGIQIPKELRQKGKRVY